jgi:predicted Zn-dependent protease
VGSWVAKHSARPELKWHFGVIDSQNINAFSAPGGYVFLTKGLYKTLNSEAELASVLAHEISHVVYKHHLAILKKSSWLELGRLAIGTKVEDDKIENMVGSGAEIMARSLDKSAEFEADKMAVILTARAGYNAYALPIVLQQIGSVSLSDPFDVELLFKTHPHPNERLSELTPFMDGFSDEGRVLSKRFYRL